MSRTSRRASRFLFGGLAIVIVLGGLFALHKLHGSHAAQARVPADDPRPAPLSQTHNPTTNPSLPTDHATPVASNNGPTTASAPDDNGLVTQTPTERTSPQTSELPVNPPAQAQDTTSQNTPAQAPSAATSEQDSPVVSAQPLVDAKAKSDTGDLIGARQVLNDSLIAGHLSDSDSDAVRKQVEQINQTLIFSARKFPSDPWGGNYEVVSGERLSTIAAKHGCTWELLSRVNGVTPRKLRSGQTIKVFKGPFHAVVYKHLFRMEIYMGAPGGAGSMYVTSFPVGLGKDNSTPTGLWLCKAGDKIRNPRYYPPHGGDVIAPDDPKNPLGGYWIAIEGQDGQALGQESYGIHGTIDPSSIGKMESMGCIRLKPADISWVFDLLVDGKSKVLIKE